MAQLNLREVEVFKPYADEFPADLLVGEGVSDEVMDRWEQAEILRIARYGGQLAAVYAMQRNAGEPSRFDLHGVVVDPGLRRGGLGRWLVGHAIGVAESKGGRVVVVACTGGSGCFEHIGFVEGRFDLIPE